MDVATGTVAARGLAQLCQLNSASLYLNTASEVHSGTDQEFLRTFQLLLG